MVSPFRTKYRASAACRCSTDLALRWKPDGHAPAAPGDWPPRLSGFPIRRWHGLRENLPHESARWPGLAHLGGRFSDTDTAVRPARGREKGVELVGRKRTAHGPASGSVQFDHARRAVGESRGL